MFLAQARLGRTGYFVGHSQDQIAGLVAGFQQMRARFVQAQVHNRLFVHAKLLRAQRLAPGQILIAVLSLAVAGQTARITDAHKAQFQFS